MAGKVFFGNINKQVWIVAPQSGMTAGSQNWSKETPLLDGSTFVRRSKRSHRRFEMSWLGEMNTAEITDSLQTIKEFADGQYGSGPFYWLDPYAVESNILPPHWATPSLAEMNWPDLAPEIAEKFFVPETVARNHPLKYVEFDTTAGYESTEKLTLILPPNYDLNFGWHGPAGSANAAVRIVPYYRADGMPGTAVNPVRIDAGSATRTNTKIKGDTYSYVEIFIATTSASTVKLTSMTAQILPEALSVAVGDFVSGRGTTGVEFATAPQMEYYSAKIGNGRIGMSASLVEV